MDGTVDGGKGDSGSGNDESGDGDSSNGGSGVSVIGDGGVMMAVVAES